MPIPLLLTVFVSSTCSYWLFHIKARRRQRHYLPCHDNKNNDDDVGGEDCAMMSSRGIQSGGTKILPYIDSHLKCLSDPCHPDTNPTGYISLCVAENKLIVSELSKRLLQLTPGADGTPSSYTSSSQIMFSNADNFMYNDTRGMEHVRLQIARFLTRHFVKGHSNHPLIGDDGGGSEIKQGNHATVLVKGNDDEKNDNHVDSDGDEHAVNPDHLLLTSGGGNVINLLCYTLAEQHDVVLVPVPYYAAFESDMRAYAGLVPCGVQMANAGKGPTVEELEVALKKVEQQGSKVKILLLTNPSNPLGTIYGPNVVLDSIAWARSRQIHTIVDEIYALSVHNPDVSKFQSVTQLLDNNLQNDVHMIWALSKDLGASGFRFGILYTQNTPLINALSNLNTLSTVPNPMQSIVGALLSDDAFMNRFLHQSREMLKVSYATLTQTLKEMDCPYIEAQAGIFVYCDFSELLPSKDRDGEAVFAGCVERFARVVMTPGDSQRDPNPGMFRICYAATSIDVLMIAMRRLKHLVRMIRNDSQFWRMEFEDDDINRVLSCSRSKGNAIIEH